MKLLATTICLILSGIGCAQVCSNPFAGEWDTNGTQNLVYTSRPYVVIGDECIFGSYPTSTVLQLRNATDDNWISLEGPNLAFNFSISQYGASFWSRGYSTTTPQPIEFNFLSDTAPPVFAMNIQPSGNVGIGTQDPQTKLAVNGTISTKEVIVSLDAAYWPDYVFGADYELPSLSEVERFIQSEGHLPGVPSREEVVDGVELGEMQRVLLEKVEELTLHLIELEKSNITLRNELKQLKDSTKLE